MKTLSKEDNYVFPLVKSVIKIFTIVILLFNIVFSQTLLNNFGTSKTINTKKGYSKFSLLDYNNDGLDDLFLYGNQEKSFIIHKGLKDSTFARAQKKFFFYPIDDIKWLTKTSEGENYYIFVSRNKRIVGLVSFTKSYSLQLLYMIEYNSYPSSVEIVDLDLDGKNEALIYGNNFNGLVLIRNERYNLFSENLLEENVIADLEIIDFNQDDVEDIISINVLNNSVNFFENTEESGLLLNRIIEYDENIFQIKSIDFNNDDIIDVGIVKEGGIDFFIGDSVYSFSKKFELAYNFTPDNFLMHDFNFDEINDLAVINKVENELIVKTDISTNENNIVYNYDGISDFDFSYNRNFLITLSNKNKVHLLSAENLWSESFSFSIGGKLHNLDFQSSNNLGYSSLAVSDQHNNDIKILKLNSIGDFSEFEKLPMANSNSELFYTIGEELISFSRNSRLLEIFSFNKLSENYNENNYYYTTYPIIDFSSVDKNTIYCLEANRNNVYIEKIEKVDNRYLTTDISLIDSLIINSKVIGNETLYWKENKNDFVLKRFKNKKSTNLLELEKIDSSNYKTVLVESNYSKNNFVISFFNYLNKEEIHFIDNNNIEKYSCKYNISSDSSITEDDLFIFNNKDNKHFLFSHNETENNLQIFKIDHLSKQVELIKYVETVYLNDYFVKEFYGDTYIVYTNSLDNCLTFKLVYL